MDNRPPIEMHVEIDEGNTGDEEIHITGRISYFMLGLLGLLVTIICSGLLLVSFGMLK
jgi:hypothetical protein